MNARPSDTTLRSPGEPDRSQIDEQGNVRPIRPDTTPRPADDTPAPGERADDWMTAAHCRGVDPELFFPHKGESSAAAKEVCFGCPVRQECYDHALANGEHFGVWGGLTEMERKAIRRSRRLVIV